MNIMEETRRMAATSPEKIELPLSRLDEFLLLGVSNRCLTTDEIEQMRQACLRGEAKVWGVPVDFTNEPSN